MFLIWPSDRSGQHLRIQRIRDDQSWEEIPEGTQRRFLGKGWRQESNTGICQLTSPSQRAKARGLNTGEQESDFEGKNWSWGLKWFVWTFVNLKGNWTLSITQLESWATWTPGRYWKPWGGGNWGRNCLVCYTPSSGVSRVGTLQWWEPFVFARKCLY